MLHLLIKCHDPARCHHHLGPSVQWENADRWCKPLISSDVNNLVPPPVYLFLLRYCRGWKKMTHNDKDEMSFTFDLYAAAAWCIRHGLFIETFWLFFSHWHTIFPLQNTTTCLAWKGHRLLCTSDNSHKIACLFQMLLPIYLSRKKCFKNHWQRVFTTHLNNCSFSRNNKLTSKKVICASFTV